ncbi:MAG: LamG-like jellyroll fold domain-containing protein [Planctomycetaceae bacterium]|nr:LamG domain-containing protein [Planctomycetaceae bacterium]
MRIQGRKYAGGIAVVAVIAAWGACAMAEKSATLMYDGFVAGAGPGAYAEHSRPYGQTPSVGVWGFDPDLGWRGNSVFYHFRAGKLTHNLLERSAGGSLGQWARQGVVILHRPLALPPVAKSGVYTFCVLIRPAEPNDRRSIAAMGVGPYRVRGRDVDQVKSKGLALGLMDSSLCVFAGGRALPMVENYLPAHTYLLMAEMTVRRDGPELVRGFWALEGQKLTEARFNSQSAGKGVAVETWSRESDLEDLELFVSDPSLSSPLEASPNDVARRDFITWDEVRLLDGPAAVPVPADESLSAPVKAPPAAPPAPPGPLAHGLVAYWPLNEGDGLVTRDAVGGRVGKLQQCSWIDDGVRGCGLRLKDPSVAGSAAVSGSVRVDPAAPLHADNSKVVTLSAWVRGGESLKGRCPILECELAGGKRMAMVIVDNRLWIEQGQSRRVADGLTVSGDNQWHHVAAAVNPAAKDDAVTFFVDGVRAGPAAPGKNDSSPTPHSPAKNDADAWRLGGEREKPAAAADIDDVGIFDRTLPAAHVSAIHSLALTRFLRYDLDQVNGLLELHGAGQGSVKIGNKTWKPAKGLKGDLGKAISSDGKFSIRLSDDGSGVASD